MSDHFDPSPKPLPGNHGQFGVNNATEEHKQLEDEPASMPMPTTPVEDERPGGRQGG